jgi:hypothetical protein
LKANKNLDINCIIKLIQTEIEPLCENKDEPQMCAVLKYNIDENTIMYSNVPINGQRTIYSILGDYFAWMCIINVVILTTIYFYYDKKKTIIILCI